MQALTSGAGKSGSNGKFEDMFLTSDQTKTLVKRLNNRSANILPEDGKCLKNKLNKKCLTMIEKVSKSLNDEKDGGGLGSGGQGAASSSGNGGSGGSDDNGTGSDNKYSVTSIRKIEDEDSFMKSVLYATLNSIKSKSNTASSDVQKTASFTPWSTPSEETLEFFYGEGVSIRVSPMRSPTFLVPWDGDNVLLTFRFHIRQLSCCQLNFIWVINRIYKDLVNLRIRTKGAADVRNNEVTNVHWSNMEVAHVVKNEDVDVCMKYLETNFSDAYEVLRRREQKPKSFSVEFEVVDSCAGLLDSIESTRGAHFMELYGVEGKSQWTLKAHSNSSSNYSNIKSIISDLEDTSISVTESSNTGNCNSSGGGSSLSSSSSSTGISYFEDLISARMDENNNNRGREKYDKKTNEFISEDKEAIFDIMDPLIMNASSKGSENSMLISAMVNFLNKAADDREEADEEHGAGYEEEKFILSSQIDCLNANSDVYTTLLVSNPTNVYRLVTFLIPNLVCMRTRNVDSKSTALSNSRWELGAGLNYKTYRFADIRMRLDKTNCRCRTLCSDSCWTDSISMKNACEKFGMGLVEEANTTKRFHSSHRVIHHEFTWLQKLLNLIMTKAGKSGTGKPAKSLNLLLNHGHLARCMEAFDTFSRCYSSAGLHHSVCPNVIAAHRKGHKIHFKNNKLCIQGRRNREKTITTKQGGQSKPAFERMVDSELTSADAQIKYASNKKLSIREYGTRVSDAPANLTKIVRYMEDFSRRNSDLLDNVVNFMEKLAEYMIMLQSFCRISIFDKSLEKYRKLKDISDDDKQKKVTVINTAISLARDFARFALENQNAAFLAAVNRKIFHSVIYTINGFRYTGTHARDVELQQFVGSISSSVVCADYYSAASSKSKNLLDGEMGEVFGESGWGREESLLSSSDSGYGNAQKKSEMFLKLYNLKDFLSDDDDDEDKVSGCSSGVSAYSSPSATETVKKRKTEDEHLEKHQQQQHLSLSDLEDGAEEDDAGSKTKKQRLSAPKEDQFDVEETYFNL